MSHLRLKPKERKAQILAAAMEVAVRDGFNSITREAVADVAKVADGTVSFHFNTMTQLKRAVARHAMRVKHGEVLAMLIADKNYKPMLKPEHIQLAVTHITG